MVKTIKIILVILLILSINACKKEKVQGPAKVPGKEALENFDKLISSIAGDLGIESYGYTLVTNTETLVLKEKGILADEAIPVGDVSNMFITVLLMQSSEKEKIDIRDNMSKYGIEGEMGKAQIKNLLSFTYNTTGTPINYNPKNYMLIYRVLENAAEKKVPKLLASNLGHKLKMKQTAIRENEGEIQGYSSLNDLIRFSMAIDNQQLFENEYTNNLMFRPVYLETGERSSSGLGCYIEIANDKKFIWSAGQTKEYTTFFIKSATDSLSLILIAKSANMNSTFNLKNGELWNTPLYHAFLNTLLKNDSTGVSVNFYDSYDAIRKSTRKMFDTGNRDGVYDELVSYLTLYKATDNSARFDSLAGIYREFFPGDIPPDKLFLKPVAEIGRVMDYMRMSRTFSIPKDTALTLFAVGEFIQEMSLSPWEYDNVEMFFDLNHERGSGFNSGADDRQYRFNYDFPSVTGNAPSYEHITLVQYDVSPTRFNFEIVIPWIILFNNDSIKPAVNQLLGFDIAIADNDNEVREGSLAWQSILNETPWSNTTMYGTMILVKTPGQPDDTICYAPLKSADFEIDGQNRGEWNRIPRYPIDKEFMAGITGPDDQSGWFRVQWDQDKLYFFIEVQDDVKRLLDKNGDYGWITTTDEDTLWMMTEANSLYAGGDQANKYVRTALPFKAGNYILHYQTNQSHAYGRWLRGRPDMSFYGIVLY